VRILGLIAAAWVVVVIACLVHVAVVLPPLLVLATASVLRGGRTLLDRLMFAVALLLGLTCAGALLFAVWPWGLDPIPVAGVAFTALILIAAAARRRPVLPRVHPTDLLSLAVAGALGVFAGRPLYGSHVDQLNRIMRGEDLARHIDLFDTIRRTGGYLFQHPDAARQHLYQGMVTYPQGSHMIDALIDGFVRSGGHNYGSGFSMMVHFYGYFACWFGLLGMAMIWAVQWLAGANLTTGRRIVLIAFVATLLVTTEPLALMVWGYPSELAGIAEMVLLVALLARPARRMRQQLLIVASLVVAVGFTYYLFLPGAGLAAAIWVLRERRRVGRYRIFAAAAALLGGALAVTPALLGLTIGGQGDAILVPGGTPASLTYLLLLVCMVLAGLIGRRALHSRIWRGYTWCAFSVAALIGGLMLVKALRGGSAGGYYVNKSVHLGIVVLAVGAGSLLHYLPAPRRTRESALRRIGSGVPAVLATVVVIASFSLMRDARVTLTAAPNTNWAHTYLEGRYGGNPTRAVDVFAEYQDELGKPPVMTYFLTASPHESYLRTLFLGTLQRTSGELALGLYDGSALDSPTRLQGMVALMKDPVRIVVDSAETMQEAQRVKDLYPDHPIEVVWAP
jgi:hypothetical protein